MADKQCAACYLNSLTAATGARIMSKAESKASLQVFGLLNALPITELLGEGSWAGL